MKIANRAPKLIPLLLLASAILFLVACGTSSPSDAAPADDSLSETSLAAGPADNAEAGSGGVTPDSVVAVSFTNDRMAPETIRVKQGDSVTLNLKSDRPGSFHIHGYDLQQEVVVGEVTPFQFLANATGRFGINFHGAPEPETEMPGTMDMGSMSGAAMEHGSKDHGPAASAVPVSQNISAEAAQDGGIHVAINTEGWRWAPVEVNGPNKDGAGHAHIYADGVKLTRVYGNYHYIPALEPGAREIKVSLNSNDHSELTWQGELLESAVSLSVPQMDAMGHHGMDHMLEPVDSAAPMSVEVVVHEDALGGYNVHVIPQGFEFSRSVEQAHEPGKGYAQLSINGEIFNRLYVPWLQVPAQGEGMHTFTVALLDDEGQPYHHNGQPVEASVEVQEEAEAEDGDAAMASHHGGGTDAAAEAGTDHHHNTGSGHDHGTEHSSGIVELEVGYLEVLP